MSALPPPPPFPRIQISQLEERAQSIRHKQLQFHHLYAALTKSAAELKLAVQADLGQTLAEVDFEFTLALSELRTHYNYLNLKKDLETARRIEFGTENPEGTRPVGIVYIVPAKWNLCYSVLSPLGAAMAAGNCVILELPQTLDQVSAILRKVLPGALDADTFAISDSRPPVDFTRQCTLVIQTEEDINHSTWSRVLQSPLSGTSVVVIDRTANIIKAAEAVANASFSFRGRSAYAPRAVLVNEFVADEFLSGLVSHVAEPSSRLEKESMTGDGHIGPPRAGRKIAKEIENNQNSRTLVAGSNGSIIEVFDLDSLLLMKKSGGPNIVVHRISSMDDALSILNRPQYLAACFVFGGLSEANYVSSFINSHMSTINHIPAELLIGPVAPMHPTIRATPSPRYTPSMFTSPKPQYLNLKSPISTSSLIQKHSTSNLKKWTAELMKPLPPIGQKDGKLIGFFEQGILVGMAMVLTSVVGTVTGVWWLLLGRHRVW